MTAVGPLAVMLKRPYLSDREVVLMAWRDAKWKRRTAQRAERRVRMARKKRRGWA